MGYIRHNAIIATGWQNEAVQALCDFAKSIGTEAISGEEMTNGYRTVIITPDGSKEGWETSTNGDARRGRIREWLRNAGERGMFFEWCEVAYGNDDGNAQVVASEWEPSNKP